MQKSGFFNALLVDGDYDRKYNANDYSDNLAVVISNGVLRSTGDDLKVIANGLTLTVSVGRAWIKGHWYYNDSALALATLTPPTGGTRYDRVVLRLDNSLAERNIEIVYLTGTASNNPVLPEITRNENIYDLVLADIRIEANATGVTVFDRRSDSNVCGWVYSTSGDNSFFTSLDNSFSEWFENARDTLASVTLFKRYTWQKTLAAQTSSVSFSIPQYDAETCFIEVYVNGILDTGYTLNGNVITFDGSLIAGTVVTVHCFKSIDGTGIMTVADEITELQNEIAALSGVSKFTYVCTGLNDNIALSEIAQAFYSGSYVASDVSTAAAAFLSEIGGNTYLAGISAEAQITIDVVGRLGATTPVYGDGSTTSRFRWFALGVAAAGSKRIVFDFAKCEKITIACAASTNNIIFYGTDLYVKNANVFAYSNGSGCAITMITGSANTGSMNFDNCRFSISCTGNAVISPNGTFTNCHCTVKTTGGDGICFDAKSASLIRLIGGTYYAYIHSSGVSKSAIMNIASTETDAAIVAHNINCPTVSASGYMQRNLAIAAAGSIYINGVCSTMTTTGTAVTVAGQIWKSKR